MSGINIINGFSKQIFEEIEKKGAKSSLSPTEQNYFIGVTGFVGTVIAIGAVAALKRKTNLIFFHFLMGISLALVAVFVA